MSVSAIKNAIASELRDLLSISPAFQNSYKNAYKLCTNILSRIHI